MVSVDFWETKASFLSGHFCAVLGFFLWPLISCHEVGLWLKPVLQKLDFGVGEFLQKIKENHGNDEARPLDKRHCRFISKQIRCFALKINCPQEFIL